VEAEAVEAAGTSVRVTAAVAAAVDAAVDAAVTAAVTAAEAAQATGVRVLSLASHCSSHSRCRRLRSSPRCFDALINNETSFTVVAPSPSAPLGLSVVEILLVLFAAAIFSLFPSGLFSLFSFSLFSAPFINL
jgi:hypothetical protein